MRALLFLVSFFSILTACAPAKLTAADEQLYPYVELFKQEAMARGINVEDLNYLKITIVPAGQMPGLHGVCVTESGTNSYGAAVIRRHIELSEAALSKGEFATRATMFHELGHCMRHLVHNDKTVNVSVSQSGVSYSGAMPVSLMNSYYFNDYQEPVAKLYWSQYVDELFGVRANPFQ